MKTVFPQEKMKKREDGVEGRGGCRKETKDLGEKRGGRGEPEKMPSGGFCHQGAKGEKKKNMS